MDPEELAIELRDEVLASLSDVGIDLDVEDVSVEAPDEVSVSYYFVVRVRGRSNDGELKQRLHAPLVAAYLADEEAAVNEYKEWLHALAEAVG